VRGNVELRLQYRAITAYTGFILALVGACMFTPLLALPAWPAEARYSAAFALPGLVLILLGGSLFAWYRPKQAVLGVQDGGLIVVLSWVGASFGGAWPLMAIERLTFTQAVFESVSGWTTTGLSVVDVSQAARLILLWRSTMQLIGGAGFAIIMLAAITGPAGTSLPSAEGRSEQLVPHIRQSAKLVLSIYLGYVLFGILAYYAVGLTPFDAVNHAFAAVSTGGFSTYPDSIGHWDSPAVEAVTLPLMLMGQLSFLTAYALLTGRLRAVFRDGEVRYCVLLLPICILVVFTLVCRELYPAAGKGLRVAVFEVASALSTTGFSTVTYASWNAFGILVLILLMLVGGGTCSTAGGLKQYRAFLLMKALVWHVRSRLLPRSAVVENYIWQGNGRVFVSDDRIRQVAVFFFLYLLSFAAGTAVLTAHGCSLSDALFEFASAQGTVGLSVGVTRPDAPPGVLWTEILGMFLGRLEFFVVLLSIAKLLRDVPVLLRRPG
jgi:trk system potassium uptake protein TrkH